MAKQEPIRCVLFTYSGDDPAGWCVEGFEGQSHHSRTVFATCGGDMRDAVAMMFDAAKCLRREFAIGKRQKIVGTGKYPDNRKRAKKGK